MKILIGYDGSECANAALVGLRNAGLPRQAEVIVVAVTEAWLPPPAALELVHGVTHEEENLALARLAKTTLESDFPAWDIQAKTAHGSPVSVILHIADEWKPDLIVLGSHGRSALGSFFFGSVSQNVLQAAPCSVRIGRGRQAASSKAVTDPVRVIIGIDGSPDAQAAVAAVAARTWPVGSEVRLVNAAAIIKHAVSGAAAVELANWFAHEAARVKQMLAESTAQLSAKGLLVHSVVKEEEAKKLLCDEAAAWQADVIFVGAHGAGRLERFLIGSVSGGVAARANCAVEVVRKLA